MREVGYANNPCSNRRLAAMVHEPDYTVAGWIVTTLVYERRGAVLPSLVEFVRRQGKRPMLSLSSGPRFLQPSTVSHAEWQSLIDLPPTTCVGALLHHPSNARLVRQMQRFVGDAVR